MDTLQIQPLEAALLLQCILILLAVGFENLLCVFMQKTLKRWERRRLLIGLSCLASAVNIIRLYFVVFGN